MRGTADVGVVHSDVLFSSDRTSKESACCFTAAAPRGAPNVDRQAAYTLPILCHLAFLPTSWWPSTPTFSSSCSPLTSHTVSESPQRSNPLCHSSIYPQPLVLVSGGDHLSVIPAVGVPSQPACLYSGWPRIRAGSQWTVWDQMFLLRLADQWRTPPRLPAPPPLSGRLLLPSATFKKHG